MKYRHLPEMDIGPPRTNILLIVYHIAVENSIRKLGDIVKKHTTLAELRAFLSDNGPHKMIFSTEEQRWYTGEETFCTEIFFENISICESPNLIMLQSAHGNLCLSGIKYVEIDQKRSSPEIAITVFCGGNTPQMPETTYTLIAA